MNISEKEKKQKSKGYSGGFIPEVWEYLEKEDHRYLCKKDNCWMNYASDSTWKCPVCSNWIPVDGCEFSIVEKNYE